MKNVRRPCQGLSLEGDGRSSGISLLHVIVMGILQDAFFFFYVHAFVLRCGVPGGYGFSTLKYLKSHPFQHPECCKVGGLLF
jgi:hypothetical protein